jgi:hypothetical protein
MALLYPWATKDYLLWQMSIGQIILYHNLGIEQKYGKKDRKPKKLSEMSAEEVANFKAQARKMYGPEAV